MRGGKERRRKASVPVTALAASTNLAEEQKEEEEAAATEEAEKHEGEELQSSIIIRYAPETDSMLKVSYQLDQFAHLLLQHLQCVCNANLISACCILPVCC